MDSYIQPLGVGSCGFRLWNIDPVYYSIKQDSIFIHINLSFITYYYYVIPR